MLKLKGRYAIDVFAHQDPSALIVPKTAKAVMVDGKDLEKYIKANRDPYDFMLRAKIPKANVLYMRYGKPAIAEEQLAHIIRYYVSVTGGYLINVKPQKHQVGQYKRANKLTDEFFDTTMREIGNDVWDERVHTKNKKVYEEHEETGICAGQTVTECSDSEDFSWTDINYDWYINEVEKILIN